MTPEHKKECVLCEGSGRIYEAGEEKLIECPRCKGLGVEAEPHKIGEHGAVAFVGKDKDICAECGKEVKPEPKDWEEKLPDLSLKEILAQKAKEIEERIEKFVRDLEKDDMVSHASAIYHLKETLKILNDILK